MTLDFYQTTAIRYFEADAETRKASKEHYQRCHLKNLAERRDDLISFTARILSVYSLVDDGHINDLFNFQEELANV